MYIMSCIIFFRYFVRRLNELRLRWTAERRREGRRGRRRVVVTRNQTVTSSGLQGTWSMDVGLTTRTSPPSSSSSSEEESEVGEEGALDDSVCPAGCDPALFSLACQLREKRMDVEESLAEEKRAAEQSRKELETAKKKLKTVDAHVKTAQSELQVNQCSP